MSRVWRWRSSPSDISSAPAEQLGQPSSHSGSNMKWPTMSWSRPSNRSSSPTLPSGPSKTYSFVDLHHGQVPPLGVQRVPLPRERLLLGQQRLAGGEPLLPVHDLGQAHGSSDAFDSASSKVETRRRPATHRGRSGSRASGGQGEGGGGPARGGHEGGEERGLRGQVGEHLGMPLHAEQKRAAGSQSASTVPSSARAATSRPLPRRSAAWWWNELTASGGSPVRRCRSEPGATVTAWAGTKASWSWRCATAVRSGRCWCSEPPRATLRACIPRQMPRTGRSRSAAPAWSASS